MNNTYLSHNNIVSSFGFDSQAAVVNIKNEVSGLQLVDNPKMLPEPFYSSLIPAEKTRSVFETLNPQQEYTRLEQILLVSLERVIKKSQ